MRKTSILEGNARLQCVCVVVCDAWGMTGEGLTPFPALSVAEENKRTNNCKDTRKVALKKV